MGDPGIDPGIDPRRRIDPGRGVNLSGNDTPGRSIEVSGREISEDGNSWERDEF